MALTGKTPDDDLGRTRELRRDDVLGFGMTALPP